MTINPALIQYSADFVGPQLFPQESLILSRDAIDLDIDGATTSGRWQTRGTLFLTSLRLVFAADKQIGSIGVEAFDLPLVYIRKAKFNQPIFRCNNLAGEVWSTAEAGGPQGSLPPHRFAFYFKNGGVGTFLPLFFRVLEAMQQAHDSHRPSQSHDDIKDTVATAFVDPSDPSKIILTQPEETDRIPSAPVYAPNYGKDEAYESINGPSR